MDVAKVITELKAGNPNIALKSGYHSFSYRESFDAKAQRKFLRLLQAINKAKPSGAKGTYIKGITISSTMGPAYDLDPNEARAESEKGN